MGRSSRGPGLGYDAYDEVTEVGRGGMGVVYRARERGSGELVAIKVLDWRGDARAAARFRREIEALGRIEHPNVVRLRGSGWRDHRPYLVMDWIAGRDLEATLFEARKRDQLPEIPWVVGCLAKVAEAAAEVHNQRLIHRDIKPANILIEDRTGRPVLVDFGLVKRGAEPGLTGSREVLGTPNFMSPEQLDPRSDFGGVSPKTDVWGLGATLYKALTGRGPFDAPTLAEVYSRILTGDPQPPRALRPEIPAWLDELCLRCLEKEPGERPGLAELLAALRSEGRAPGRRGSAPARRKRILGAAVLIAAALALLIGIPRRAAPVRWERLEDARRWSTTAEDEQRAIAAAVDEALGEAFVFVGLRSYAGRPPMPIARFRHVETGAVLHLIPGGSMTMGRDLSRADREQIDEAAAALERVRAERRRLEGYIADPRAWLEAEMERITVVTDASGRRMARGDRSVVVKEMSFLTEDSAEEWRHVKNNLGMPQSTSRSDIIDLLMSRKILLVGLRNEYLKRKRAHHEEELKRRPAVWRREIQALEGEVARLRLVAGLAARAPAHPVRLEAPFLIGEAELSWRAWGRVPGHRSRRPGDGEDRPVRDLSWDEAAAWLAAVGDGLRLPSETEWEYACRARTTGRYYWGDESSDAHCLSQAAGQDGPRSARAKDRPANAFGLVDMLGNVAEWCADDWRPDYSGKDASAAPRRGEDTEKVVRGGGYDSPEILCRSRARWRQKRSERAPSLGLRLARSLDLPHKR